MVETSWKIGQPCFVLTNRHHPATVIKIGSRWLHVQTNVGKAVYQFDLSKSYHPVKGDHYGHTPRLMTPEEALLDMSHDRARTAVQKLLDFERKCDDVLVLEDIARMVSIWTDPAGTKRGSYEVAPQDLDLLQCGANLSNRPISEREQAIAAKRKAAVEAALRRVEQQRIADEKAALKQRAELEFRQGLIERVMAVEAKLIGTDPWEKTFELLTIRWNGSALLYEEFPFIRGLLVEAPTLTLISMLPEIERLPP